MTRTLYALRTTANGFIMAKFEDGVTFDVVGTYTIIADPQDDGEYTCDCPSHKRPCKHVEMLVAFSKAEAADTDQFYDPKTNSWHSPLAPITEGDANDMLEDFAELGIVEATPEGLERDEALAYSEGLVDAADKEEAQAEIIGNAAEFIITDEPRPHPALGPIKRRF